MDRVLEESAQPPARDLHLLDGGREVAPDYGRSRGFHLPRVRRRREVSLLPFEHGLWPAYRLAGDEFHRPAHPPRHLPGRAGREGPLAAVARNRRRTAARERWRIEGRA